MEKELDSIVTNTPFFTMELKNIKYEIFTPLNGKGNIYPYGVVHVTNQKKEVLRARLAIEEVALNLVKSFGYNEELEKKDISYISGTQIVNGKETLVMDFFGPFGSLKIDEIGNLVYDKNDLNP